MKKLFLLLVLLNSFALVFAATASWNYNTQTGNIGTTYNWIDASGGTELSLSDDARANIQWPFDFNIYDDSYAGGTDNISVCSNGYMRFDGDANTDYQTASGYDLTSDATSLGQIVCVGIQDCNVGDTNSHVFWNVTGSSPNRILTIEYQDLEIDYNDNLYADIEVQFYEADNKIVILFGDDDVTATSADQGIHSGVDTYFYKWNDVDTNTNQTWLELTKPAAVGPGAPTNPNPADNATNIAVDNDPDISWTNPSGTVYNEVYFGTDQTLVDNMDASVKVLGDGSTIYSSYNQTSDLSYSTTYYWKVVEYNNAKASSEGPVWSFTTQTACPDPSAQTETNISDTSADLGWTENGSATTWEIEWGATGFTQGNGTMVMGITSNPYTLSGLSENTTYDWYVRANCGSNGNSNWVGPHTFTTKCASVSSFPWSESFENGGNIPNCWKNDANDGGADWEFVTNNSHGPGADHTSGNGYYALLNDYDIHTSDNPLNLLTPELDLSEVPVGKAYELSYYYWIGPDAGDDPIHIDISNDGGVNWTNDVFVHDHSITGSWAKNIISLLNYDSNNVIIRFRGISIWGNDTDNSAIDDVEVQLIDCPSPSNQTENNITINSAELNWTENGLATAWKIQYGATGFSLGSGTIISTTNKPYTLSGLSESTTYDWYVQADCDTSGTSYWIGPHVFTTKKAPVDPPIYQNFESPNLFTTGGWTKENTNGDNKEWEQATGKSRSGSYSMKISFNNSQAMDDWFFTEPLHLTANVSYVVDFWYACESENYTEKLEVFWGTNNSSADMTYGPIFSNDNITNTDYKEGHGLFSPSTTGTYYIGFHGHSAANMYSLYIDDVIVRSNYVTSGDIIFSEVCDNIPGNAENTAFIEIFNKRTYPLTLSGDQILMGDSGIFDDYILNIPTGISIAPLDFVVISNGANLSDFNTAWTKNLTSGQFVSDNGLALTTGKAYAYNTINNSSKEIIDETPTVDANKRIVRKKDGSWDTTTTTNDGTPGEISGGDELLANVLVSFAATFQAHELTLTWAVSSQTNISQWNLYRGEENKFASAQKIASLDVEGTDTGMHEYSFTDNFNYVINNTYYYWIESVDFSGSSELLGNTSVTINEHNNQDVPTIITYGLRNYPNPFNPSTRIEFAVKEAGNATLYIYNIKGQLVRKVNKGNIDADKVYKYDWNGTDMNNKEVGSGVYLYKLITPKEIYTNKMILLK